MVVSAATWAIAVLLATPRTARGSAAVCAAGSTRATRHRAGFRADELDHLRRAFPSR